jgi:predicted nuclease of predicted toxin-antitoxin system
MVRLLTDENFHGDAVKGLLSRRPELNLVRVQDVGLAQTIDSLILAWAAANDRILLTHDKATVPGFAYERIVLGEPMPGVFVADHMTVREIIEEVLLIDTASERKATILLDSPWEKHVSPAQEVESGEDVPSGMLSAWH